MRRFFTQDSNYAINVERVKDGFALDGEADALVSQNHDAALLARLFPSPAGFIEPSTTHSLNFGQIMKRHEENAIILLVIALYFNSLSPEKRRAMQVSIPTMESFRAKADKSYFTIRIEGTKTVLTFNIKAPTKEEDFALFNRNVIETLRILFEVDYQETNNPLLSRNLILQAFIAQFLYRRGQYVVINEEYMNLTNNQLEFPNDDLNKLIYKAFYEGLNRIADFPYSVMSQPAQTVSVPIYIRNVGFRSEATIPNCVEYAMYHFLNCILWTSEESGSYQFSSSVKTTNPVVSFFRTSNGDHGGMKANLSMEDLKKWHALIEDLENGQFLDSFRLDRLFTTIAYQVKKPGKNEIAPGFMNFFCVLATIFKETDYYKSEMERIYNLLKNETVFTSSHKKYFEDFVKEFMGKIAKLDDSFQVKVNELKIDFVGRNVKKKPDFFGELEISRDIEINPVYGKRNIGFILSHNPKHAYVRMLPKYKCNLSDLPEAATLFEKYRDHKDSRYLISLFLKNICETSSPQDLKSPFDNELESLLYNQFFQTEMGCTSETFDYFNTVNDVAFNLTAAYVNNPAESQKMLDKYLNVMTNIILTPLPITSPDVFERIQNFYHLVSLFANISEWPSLFENIFPKVPFKNGSRLSAHFETFSKTLPKPGSEDFFAPASLKQSVSQVEVSYKSLSEINPDIIASFDLNSVFTLKNVAFLDRIRFIDLALSCTFNEKFEGELNFIANAHWAFLQFRINAIVTTPATFKHASPKDKVGPVLREELMREIPKILSQLHSPEHDALHDELMDLLCFAWLEAGHPDNIAVINLIQRHWSLKQFLLLCLYLDRETLLKHFEAKIKQTEYSTFLAKFWIEHFGGAELFEGSVLQRWISKLVSKVGVPRIANIDLTLLRQFYSYYWNMFRFYFQDRSFNVNDPFTATVLFFLAQAIHHEGSRELDRTIVLSPVSVSRTMMDQVRAALRNVQLLGIEETERTSIIDSFMTLFTVSTAEQDTATTRPSSETSRQPGRYPGVPTRYPTRIYPTFQPSSTTPLPGQLAQPSINQGNSSQETCDKDDYECQNLSYPSSEPRFIPREPDDYFPQIPTPESFRFPILAGGSPMRRR